MKKLKKVVAVASAVSLLGLGTCFAQPVENIAEKGWVSEESGLPEKAYKKLTNIAVDLAVDLDDDGTPDRFYIDYVTTSVTYTS